MSETETLVDRYSSLEEEESDDNTIFISTVFVDKQYNIIGESVLDDEHTIGHLNDLKSETMSDLIKTDEYTYSESCIDKLKEIEISFNMVYDDRYNMFELEINKNKYNQSHQLYIDFDSDLIDNIVITEIYNKDGEFVGDYLEESLGSDLMYIESEKLFVKYLRNPDKIYREKDINHSYLSQKYLKKNTLGREFVSIFGSLLLLSAPFIMILTLFDFDSIITFVYLTIPFLYFDEMMEVSDRFLDIVNIFGYLKEWSQNDSYLESI